MLRETPVMTDVLAFSGRFSAGEVLASHNYAALPNMKQERAEPLMAKFDEMLREHRVFREVFGLICLNEGMAQAWTCSRGSAQVASPCH